MQCKICNTVAAPFETTKVLGKYKATYYLCGRCGLLQVADPFWLDEAYQSAITATDIGYARRNLYASKLTKVCITLLFKRAASYVDYGGGYGLFVRLMRDAGLNFFRHDRYCQNLFATGFEADANGKYELLTAFEVFEHLAEPRRGLEEMLALSDNVLFSTFVLPAPPPRLEDWWYYGLHHGQHLIFYTVTALQLLANQFGCQFLSNNHDLHLLTRQPVSRVRFHLLRRRKLVLLLAKIIRYPSLLESDYNLLRAQAEKS